MAAAEASAESKWLQLLRPLKYSPLSIIDFQHYWVTFTNIAAQPWLILYHNSCIALSDGYKLFSLVLFSMPSVVFGIESNILDMFLVLGREPGPDDMDRPATKRSGEERLRRVYCWLKHVNPFQHRHSVVDAAGPHDRQ